MAALAGLPSGVVERARDLLIFLEGQAQGARAGSEGTPDTRESGQSSLYGWMLGNGENHRLPISILNEEPTKEIVVQEDPVLREIAERLESLDPTLTPREALEALYAMRAALNHTLDGKHLEE